MNPLVLLLQKPVVVLVEVMILVLLLAEECLQLKAFERVRLMRLSVLVLVLVLVVFVVEFQILSSLLLSVFCCVLQVFCQL